MFSYLKNLYLRAGREQGREGRAMEGREGRVGERRGGKRGEDEEMVG